MSAAPTFATLIHPASMAAAPAVSTLLGRANPGPLDQLAFMVGCWRGSAYGGEGVVEERFTPALGDMMLGVTRYLRGRSVELFEFHRIQVVEDGVVLVPYPRGRESVPFRLIVAAAGRAVFENLDHDFPVRIIYRITDGDRLVVRIEGTDGSGAEWGMTRCGTDDRGSSGTDDAGTSADGPGAGGDGSGSFADAPGPGADRLTPGADRLTPGAGVPGPDVRHLGADGTASMSSGSSLSVALVQEGPPSTDIFMVELENGGAGVREETLVALTDRPGYDNQPFFVHTCASFLYTSIRDDGQADIYRYDLAAGESTRITDTPESEYSPKLLPGGSGFSVVRVERGGRQRLWAFDLDGSNPRLLIEELEPVGYHAWIDGRSVALFVLGDPPTLRIHDLATDESHRVDEGIGRSLSRVPGRKAVSYPVLLPDSPPNRDRTAGRPSQGRPAEGPPTGDRPTEEIATEDRPAEEDTSGDRWAIRIFELPSNDMEDVAPVLKGSEANDTAWTPDGSLLMARGGEIFRWDGGRGEWTEIADLTGAGLVDITRIAVSPDGSRLLLVSGRDGEPSRPEADG